MRALFLDKLYQIMIDVQLLKLFFLLAFSELFRPHESLMEAFFHHFIFIFRFLHLHLHLHSTNPLEKPLN